MRTRRELMPHGNLCLTGTYQIPTTLQKRNLLLPAAPAVAINGWSVAKASERDTLTKIIAVEIELFARYASDACMVKQRGQQDAQSVWTTCLSSRSIRNIPKNIRKRYPLAKPVVKFTGEKHKNSSRNLQNNMHPAQPKLSRNLSTRGCTSKKMLRKFTLALLVQNLVSNRGKSTFLLCIAHPSTLI